jgi:hypothetical protein
VRSSRHPGAVVLALLCLLLGAGCSSVRTIDRRTAPPRAGWLVVTFPAPRAVRTTLADGTTLTLENVSALRGPLVAAAGDTVTLRMDLAGCGLRIGAATNSMHPAEDVRHVTFVRDDGTSVRQLRVSLVRTAALVMLVALLPSVVQGIATLGDCCAVD